jgi:ribonucleoside-triphosphate reductase
MIIEYSFDEQFKKDFKKLDRMDKSYQLRELDGIGEQLDVNEFSKKFFNCKGTATADVSVDSNANLDSVNIVHYNKEFSKPAQRLNSYYILWKYGRRLFGESFSLEAITKQFTKEIYINDFHSFGGGLDYSYYRATNLILKIDNRLTLITVENLFLKFKEFVDIFPDREEINIKKTNKNIQIYDKNKFIDLLVVLRHKRHNDLIKLETKNGLCTVVTENHPVILENGNFKDAEEISLSDNLKECHLSLPKGNISVKDAYIIGFYLGDGWSTYKFTDSAETKELIDRNIRSANLYISQNNIKKHKIIKELEKNGYNLIYSKNKNNCDQVAYGNKKEFLRYLDLGIIGKSNKKTLPIDILNWDDESKKQLLSGLIDSDGQIDGTGQVKIGVNSFAIIQQCAELFKLLNCGKIRTSFAGKFQSKLGYKINYEMYRLSIRLNDRDFIKFSQKVKDNESLVYIKRAKDGRYETNKLNKIQVLKDKEEWVYDVTTSTGTFYSQGMLQHNCWNFSCIDIMYLGLPFVTRVTSSSPKHLDTYFNQLMELVAFAGNNQSGATSIADTLIVASYYVDKLYKENKEIPVSFLDNIVKQNIQSFIYRCNQLYRDAAQTAFTNVSLYDDIFLDQFCKDYTFLDNSKPNKETIKTLQRIYIETMNDILEKSPATFPVTTACFSIDDENNIQDEEFLNFISEANMKFGFINIYAGKTSTLSSCCRLRSDINDEFMSSTFGGSSKIGSCSIVTLNLPRLAYTSKTKEEFLEKLKEDVILICKINQIRRYIIKKRIDNKHAPLYNLGFKTLTRQYSTCGLTGINEALEILGMDILKEDGQNFVLEMMKTINDTNSLLSKRYKVPVNCEQVPGETSALKLCKADKLLGYNKNYNLYSNQFIPLTKEADIFDRIKLQALFDKHFSGGSICHLNMVDKITSKPFMKKLIKETIKKGVIYHAVNYNIQKCIDNHITIGKNIVCSKCGKEIVENLTRIVGFLVPVKNWNKERRTIDYPNRVWYNKEEVNKV